jgi:PIN domain nuclease of toxin-antitoxin system
MNLLLDTHVLLWWLNDDSALSEKVRTAIVDGKNLVFISAVSVWEIRIKEALNKLKIPANFKSALADQPFEPPWPV